jgi:hypothetical protein
MFKRLEPKKALETILQFPHCDQRVLHAPGECDYCDEHPEWQDLRLAWGIAFTGYTPEGNELPCPATRSRPLDVIEAWHGNVAVVSNAEPAADDICGWCQKSYSQHADRTLNNTTACGGLRKFFTTAKAWFDRGPVKIVLPGNDMLCGWCGNTYAAHLDKPGAVIAKVPCGLLKSQFAVK